MFWTDAMVACVMQLKDQLFNSEERVMTPSYSCGTGDRVGCPPTIGFDLQLLPVSQASTLCATNGSVCMNERQHCKVFCVFWQYRKVQTFIYS